MSAIEDITQKAKRTSEELKLQQGILQKLTAMATHPGANELDEEHKKDVFAAIGRASVNMLLLKNLYKHQKRCINSIKRNEFFVFPLVVLIKIIKFITGRKS